MIVESQTRSAVVIHDSHREPVVGVAVQLLSVLGHAVEVTDSVDAALRAATAHPTELLVLSTTDAAEQSQIIDYLATLPANHRPKQIAILSEEEAETGIGLQRRLPNVKLHIFVKPIHAMGLLNVIKRITEATAAHN